MLKIAIIDSGIEHTHSKLLNAKITQYHIAKSKKNDKFEIYKEHPVDYIGHGTACAGIIHKYVPDAEIISLRLFTNNLVASEELLVALLQYCINIKVNIINCSVGIKETSSEELYKVCQNAYDENIHIVAACANDINTETYPAFYPFVFSATSGLIKGSEWGYIPQKKPIYITKGTLQRVLSINNQYNITGGTSLACPHLTSIVANFLFQNGKSPADKIHAYLKKNAKENIQPLQLFIADELEAKTKPSLFNFPRDLYANERLNWMKKIAVFPASDKEIDSIIKFEKSIPFELIYTIDYPRSFKREKNEKINYGITEIDYQSFDTLVIGYFSNQLFENNLQCGYELITNCLKNNIHIFCLSPVLYRYILNVQKVFPGKSIIYTPSIGVAEFDKITYYKHLPNPKCPILSVIGTGSKQGKLSTQLIIKSILEKSGYRVGFIGTEPQSEILGANFCFPIGYQENVSLTGEKKIKYLRSLMRIMSHYLNPDIIITGTQGWTITRSVFSEADETSMANFLYGIQPDALICALNPEDTIEIIEKNIQAATLFTQSKCIFYVLTPYHRKYQNGITLSTRLNETKYQEKLSYFTKKLNAPVLDIFNKTNNKLIISLISGFFS